MNIAIKAVNAIKVTKIHVVVQTDRADSLLSRGSLKDGLMTQSPVPEVTHSE